MATINLTQSNNKQIILGDINGGDDFKLTDSTGTWLGTRLNNMTVIMYKHNELELRFLPLATRVTPMFINLTITSSETA